MRIKKNINSYMMMFLIVFLTSKTGKAQREEQLSGNLPLSVLKAEIHNLKKNTGIQKGTFSICVYHAKENKIVISENPHKSLTPASNLKLVTTATALKLLGDTFTYKTYFAADTGISKEGVLEGNIYVFPSGDPSLGCSRFEGYPDYKTLVSSCKKKIKEAGVKHIKGGIVICLYGFTYNPIPDYWTWGDLGNYYGAGNFGLNFNENMYYIYLKPGTAVGSKTQIIRTEPSQEFTTIINEVTTAAQNSGDNAYLYTAPRSSILYMSGSVPSGVNEFAVRGAMPNPPLQFANILHQELLNDSIKISSLPKIIYENISLAGKKILLLHTSPPLSEIIKAINVYSLNLYAECLLQTVGRLKSSSATYIDGIKTVQEFWKSKGIDISGWHMYDGSGLSLNNTITTSIVCGILNHMAADAAFKSFYASLPVAGKCGTVHSLCKGGKAENNARVKSGTLNKVCAYSGYVTGQGGSLYSFSLFFNNYDIPRREVIRISENIINKIAELD
ncbi:MAG: D-alanyl-D-alanine carboxypeptidase/D-alanyl-D-alanine-endopeptidase [Cytophagaceae bacterium]|nr:D-alanyl-D-alanine carboxypeptidase/D-alanyl-D-alanine-endopeptidase [Cytophagaceae bacterium]MDW8457171.1 D-alanyl-D-alanine carboxypeptidase/D-alanyl-D-alanine-endopeptidase [Cytophagaceae bacterium]